MEVSNYEADPWLTRMPGLHSLFDCVATPNADERNSEFDRCCERLLGRADDEFDFVTNSVSCIDEVMTKVASVPSALALSQAAYVLRRLSEHEILTAFLRFLLANADHLHLVAKESSHHDLFDKVVLLGGSRSSWKLRMHVFHERRAFALSKDEVHTHRNHFLSSILVGGLRQSVWEECVEKERTFVDAKTLDLDTSGDRGTSVAVESVRVCRSSQCSLFQRSLYSPSASATPRSVSELSKSTDASDSQNLSDLPPNVASYTRPAGSDLVRLEKVIETTHGEGSIYYMHSSVLHSVEEVDEPTVTLVLHFPQSHRHACFATLGNWETKDFIRENYQESDLVSSLQRVISLLHK